MTDSVLTPEKLAVKLDHAVRTLRNLLTAASRMDEHGRLGSAARIPDELGRVIPVVEGCRNAATFEAIGSQLQEVTA